MACEVVRDGASHSLPLSGWRMTVCQAGALVSTSHINGYVEWRWAIRWPWLRAELRFRRWLRDRSD